MLTLDSYLQNLASYINQAATRKCNNSVKDGEPHDRAGWKSEMMLWKDGRTKECGRFQDVEVDEGVRKRQVRPEK